LVEMNNEDGIVIASGPGVVHIHQPETEADNAAPGAAPAKPRPDQGAKPAQPAKQLMLTRVSYLHRMWANNRNRTAFFTGDVDVVHGPAENPDVVVDVDRPPPGYMHMHCELLNVYSKRQPDGRITQEMTAQKKVWYNAQEFWGRAEVVEYDEKLDRIILDGGPSGTATLYREKVQAGDRNT